MKFQLKVYDDNDNLISKFDKPTFEMVEETYGALVRAGVIVEPTPDIDFNETWGLHDVETTHTTT